MNIPTIIRSANPCSPQIKDRWKQVRLSDAWPIVKDIARGLNTEVGGPANFETEKNFRDLTGCRYALPVNSGTATLHSAFFALGVRPGDEVIVPSYTFFASATPLFQLGAKPVFCEIDPRTLTADPIDVERRITPRTKAICVVHVWGNPANMQAFSELSKRTGIPIVEDCSHAHGATYAGKSVGSFGAIGCFSMQGSKAVSGGEAGVIVTNDPVLYDRMLALGHNGRTDRDQVAATFGIGGLSYGLKYRPHLFALRLANSSMKRLSELNKRRTENLEILSRAFSKDGVLESVEKYPEAQRGGFLEFIFRYHPERAGGWSRQAFVLAVQAEGYSIGVDRYSSFGANFRYLHEASIFSQVDDRQVGGVIEQTVQPVCPLPVTEETCMALVTIPAYTKVSKTKLERFASAVGRVADAASKMPDLRAVG
jgi:perosamine synthetase